MNTNDIHIQLPSSKSISNRWLVVNHLLPGHYVLRNISDSDDTQLLATLLYQLRHGKTNTFPCGNAGTVARFLTALLAFTPGVWTLTGNDRLCQRPISALVDALCNMGCNIHYLAAEGHLPIIIHGTIPQNKMVTIDSSESSQFASALLLAGTMLPNGITVNLAQRPSSRPYIHMTCGILQTAGMHVFISPNQRVFRVDNLSQCNPSTTRHLISMERDWSAAAFFYAAAALVPGRRIRLQGLSLSNTLQGDCEVTNIFKHLGVTTRQLRSPYKSATHSIVIEGNNGYDKIFSVNFIDTPDLLPSVLVTSCVLGIEAHFRRTRNLRIKESDRLQALQSELHKLGAKIDVGEDETTVHPVTLTPPADGITLCSHGDHRIAMALGVLTLRYPQVCIDHPEVVSKSFPTFWQQLHMITADGAVPPPPSPKA